jgi:hypothetical protein
MTLSTPAQRRISQARCERVPSKKQQTCFNAFMIDSCVWSISKLVARRLIGSAGSSCALFRNTTSPPAFACKYPWMIWLRFSAILFAFRIVDSIVSVLIDRSTPIATTNARYRSSFSLNRFSMVGLVLAKPRSSRRNSRASHKIARDASTSAKWIVNSPISNNSSFVPN